MFKEQIMLMILLLQYKYNLIIGHEDKKILLTSIQGSTIKIYDVFKGRCLLNLDYHSHNISAHVFTKDGSKLYTSGVPNIFEWNLKSGSLTKIVSNPELQVKAMELNEKEGILFISPPGGFIIQFNTTDPFFQKLFQKLLPLNINILKISPDNKKLYIASVNSPRPGVGYAIIDLPITPLSPKFVENKTFLTEIYNTNIREKKLSKVNKVLGFYLSNQLNLFLFSSELGIHIYDFEKDEEKLLLKDGGFVNAISFNVDGSLFASAFSDGYVLIWNTNNYTKKVRLKGHNNSVVSLDFSESEYLVIGYEDGSINVWNTSNYSCIINITSSKTSDKALVKVIKLAVDSNKESDLCYWNPETNKNIKSGVFLGNNFIICKEYEPNCDDCTIVNKEIACLKNNKLCGENCLICDEYGNCKKCLSSYHLKIGSKDCTKCNSFDEYLDSYSNNNMQTGTGVCLNSSKCNISFCKKCFNKYSNCEDCANGYSLAPSDCKNCDICVSNKKDYESFLTYFVIFLSLIVIFLVLAYVIIKIGKKFKKQTVNSSIEIKITSKNPPQIDEISKKDSLLEGFLEFFLNREKLIVEYEIEEEPEYKEKSIILTNQNIELEKSENSANSSNKKVDTYYEFYCENNITGNSRLTVSRLIDNFKEENEIIDVNNHEKSFYQPNSSQLINTSLKYYLCPNPNRIEESLKFSKLIYQSSSCDVSKFKMDGEKYAIKIIKPKDENEFKNALKRIKIFLKVQCSQIVKLYWIFLKKNNTNECHEIYIIMDYLNASLENVLKSRKFKNKEIIWILKKLVRCLVRFENFTEETNLVHCDIEPANVLLHFKNNSICKDKIFFANFGVGAICKKGEEINVKAKNKTYAAPEVIKSSKASVKSDIYSLGLITLNIIGLSNERFEYILEKLKANRNHEIEWDELTSELSQTTESQEFYIEIINLVKSMLHYEPKKRIKAEEILKKLRN